MNRSKKQVRRQSKQQSNRRSQLRKSLRKQSKSRQSRKQLNRRSRRSQRIQRGQRSQRGGNYFLNVGAQRIGGLSEVARVDDPIAPIAGASKTTFPSPLYTQPAQQTVTVPSSTVTGAGYNGNGMTSVFHDTMTQRDFSCKGPQWAPSCI